MEALKTAQRRYNIPYRYERRPDRAYSLSRKLVIGAAIAAATATAIGDADAASSIHSAALGTHCMEVENNKCRVEIVVQPNSYATVTEGMKISTCRVRSV